MSNAVISRIQAAAIRALLLVACIAPSQRAAAATHTWTGAAGTARWSTAGNWSGGAPAAGEVAPVIVVFPPSGPKVTTNDIANLTLDQIQVTGDNYLIAASGNGTNVTLRSQLLGSTFFLTGASAVITNFNFTIATNFFPYASVAVSSGDTATLRSRFTGPGGLVKRAAGTLVLRGPGPNTYAGTTEVEGGLLQLNQTGNAIPGPLVIGDPTINLSAGVELLFQNQIADISDILVNSNGTFNGSVFSDTVHSITLLHADLTAGIGLTFLGDFTSVGDNTVNGILRLGGADRVIDVTGSLNLDAFLENAAGTAGIIKKGPGALELKRANTFNGPVTVQEGSLRVSHANALGTAAGGATVQKGASIELRAGIATASKDLSIEGNGDAGQGALVLRNGSVWNGAVASPSEALVSVAGAGDLATQSGRLGPGSFTKIGAGALTLSGFTANTADKLTVLHGTLRLSKLSGVAAVAGSLHIGDEVDDPKGAVVQLNGSEQIPTSAEVFVDASGLLDLNGFSETVGALTLRRGLVQTGIGTLTLTDTVKAQKAAFDPYFSGSTVSGRAALGGQTRVFDAPGGTSLWIEAALHDGAGTGGIQKIGQGLLELMSPSNDYSGITLAQQGTLMVHGGGKPGSSAAGTVVVYPAEFVISYASVTNETLIFQGIPAGQAGALSHYGDSLWTGAIQIQGDVVASGPDPGWGRLNLSGPVGGTGRLTLKRGDFRFSGSADNAVAGGIKLDVGSLQLAKTAGAVAIPSDLTLGVVENGGTDSTVLLLAGNQIANSAKVQVNRTGLLDLGGFPETVGVLGIDGGRIETGAGTLTLLGDLNVGGLSNFGGRIEGQLSLGGATRKVLFSNDGYLNLNAQISDGGGAAGLNIQGQGLLYLDGPNLFSGPVTIDQTHVSLRHAGSLGSPLAGTTVLPGGKLSLIGGVHVGAEPLSISGEGGGLLHDGALQCNGTNSWSGTITLYGDATVAVQNHADSKAELKLTGAVVGDGNLIKKDTGTLILGGTLANNYGGVTLVKEGTLLLSKTAGRAVPGTLQILSSPGPEPSLVLLGGNGQLGNLASVSIATNALLSLADHSTTIGSLSGAGGLALGTGIITLGGNNQSTVFDGPITGTGNTNVTKQGTGSFTLNGVSTATGLTRVQAGTLVVNGSLANSTVRLNSGAVLAGTGTVGSILSVAGTIAPGDVGAAPRFGRLRSKGSVSLDGASQLRIELGGSTPGTDADQLVVENGALVLNGCQLDVQQFFPGSVGEAHAIIEVVGGGAAMGTFSGLPEGTTVISSTGRSFRVNYAAGSGANDVLLTQEDAGDVPATDLTVQSAPNGILLQGLGSPNGSYKVEATEDLGAGVWVELGTVSADANGALQFTDTDAAQHPIRFYRFLPQ